MTDQLPIVIKEHSPGKGWPQYGPPHTCCYGHAVEVFQSSIAFEVHAWMRVFDPGGVMQDGYPDEGCDVMVHMSYDDAVAIRDRLNRFINDPAWRQHWTERDDRDQEAEGNDECIDCGGPTQ